MGGGAGLAGAGGVPDSGGLAAATSGPGLIVTFGCGGAGGCENSNRLREPPSIGTFRTLASRSSFSVGSIRVTSTPSFSLSDGRKSSMTRSPRPDARCVGMGPEGAGRGPSGFNTEGAEVGATDTSEAEGGRALGGRGGGGGGAGDKREEGGGGGGGRNGHFRSRGRAIGPVNHAKHDYEYPQDGELLRLWAGLGGSKVHYPPPTDSREVPARRSAVFSRTNVSSFMLTESLPEPCTGAAVSDSTINSLGD